LGPTIMMGGRTRLGDRRGASYEDHVIRYWMH
jgi:hypothetical protein